MLRPPYRQVWLPLAMVFLFLLPAPGAAAQSARLVYPGATVRVAAPSVGGLVYLGRYTTARVRGTLCHGVALLLPGSDGQLSLILLKGITRLEVDRRTNVSVAVIGLGDPAPEDWQTIDLTALRKEDSTCAVRAGVGG